MTQHNTVGGNGRTTTPVPAVSGTSRFAPDEHKTAESVAAANDRAQRLALRILAAEKAIKRGSPTATVLSILGGAEDE